MTKKTELNLSISFVDKDGNLIEDPDKVFASMTQSQRNQHRALVLEATTGKRHIPQ